LGFGDFANIFIAAILLIFFIRDIIVSLTKEDHSKSKHAFIRWFFSSKEQVIALHFLRGLGLTREELKDKIYDKEPNGYRGAIDILVNCIEKADKDGKYLFGSGGESRHSSPYYLDSQGFSQNKDNCNHLYNVMLHLINKVDTDYDYVFSIKGGNIPLAAAFPKNNYNILSIMPKEQNEIVDSGTPNEDVKINYEGLRLLIEKAKQNGYKEIKGIAVTCNLSNGSRFLKAIKNYNEKIEELKHNDSYFPENIKKIENVYILYRAITEDKLDRDFKDADLKCYRYFDLDDDLKACLYSIKMREKEIDDFTCHQCIKWKREPQSCMAKHCYRSLI